MGNTDFNEWLKGEVASGRIIIKPIAGTNSATYCYSNGDLIDMRVLASIYQDARRQRPMVNALQRPL